MVLSPDTERQPVSRAKDLETTQRSVGQHLVIRKQDFPEAEGRGNNFFLFFFCSASLALISVGTCYPRPLLYSIMPRKDVQTQNWV